MDAAAVLVTATTNGDGFHAHEVAMITDDIFHMLYLTIHLADLYRA